MLKLLLKKERFIPLLAGLFAVTLQIQITLFAQDGYLGLRLNSADLLLPFVGIFILTSLLLKTSEWPEWQAPFGYWAVGLLGAAILYALLNAYLLYGAVSQWALINKTIGWFVVLAYLGAGAWCAQNAKNSTKSFTKLFMLFFCLTVILNACAYYIHWELDLRSLEGFEFAIKGFMANRNAFGFLFLVVFLLVILTHERGSNERFSKYYAHMHAVFWFILPLCIVLISSRAVWILVLPILFFFFF